ncbi:MAG: metallophosphoesterase [Henriciella sp.]
MTRIIQVADIHFGTENPVALDAFGAAIDTIEPDAIAVCGDLTQRGKRSEFRAARDWLDSFAMPKLVVAGNHDTPLLNLYERVVAPFERHDSFFADLADPVHLDRASLVGLNTARGWQTRSNWAEGAVNLDDLDEAISDAHESETHRGFLVCHHPFLSPPDAPLRTATKRGRRASRRLARSSIRFLLTGHVHAPSVTVIEHKDRAYIAVSAGTLSTRLRNTPASFNVIDVSGPSCIVTVHNLHGDRFVPEMPHTLAPNLAETETHLIMQGEDA